MSAILERLRAQAKKELKAEETAESKTKKSKAEKEQEKITEAVEKDKEKKAAKRSAKKAASGKVGVAAIKAAAEAKKAKATKAKATKAKATKTKATTTKATAKKTTAKKTTAKKTGTKKATAKKVKATGTTTRTACGLLYTQHLTTPKKEQLENIDGTPYYVSNHGRVYARKNTGALRECITLIYGRVPIADLRASGERVRFKIADKIDEFFGSTQAKRFAELNNNYAVDNKE